MGLRMVVVLKTWMASQTMVGKLLCSEFCVEVVVDVVVVVVVVVVVASYLSSWLLVSHGPVGVALIVVTRSYTATTTTMPSFQ